MPGDAIDYSRFYFVAGQLIGLSLYCLDCDEDDQVVWVDDDDPAAHLGGAIASADRHWAEKHARRP